MQLVKGGSPVIARGPDRTNCEPISSDTLHALKEEARIANEHLRITREDYKAWQAASARLYKQHAAELSEQHILRAHITIVDELNQLLDEQEEYDATRHNPI
jgi:hypothetical protein